MNSNASSFSSDNGTSVDESADIASFADAHEARSYDVLHEKVIVLSTKVNRQSARIKSLEREIAAMNAVLVGKAVLMAVLVVALVIVGLTLF